MEREGAYTWILVLTCSYGWGVRIDGGFFVRLKTKMSPGKRQSVLEEAFKLKLFCLGTVLNPPEEKNAEPVHNINAQTRISNVLWYTDIPLPEVTSERAVKPYSVSPFSISSLLLALHILPQKWLDAQALTPMMFTKITVSSKKCQKYFCGFQLGPWRPDTSDFWAISPMINSWRLVMQGLTEGHTSSPHSWDVLLQQGLALTRRSHSDTGGSRFIRTNNTKWK